jgi:hypothetical protein
MGTVETLLAGASCRPERLILLRVDIGPGLEQGPALN